MSTEEIKADINIRPEELEAIKKAQVIRLTDGTEYVRKDVAEKVMEEYAGKELASLKEENAKLKEADSFNLPHAAIFNLQQIALADDEMVKQPGAAEQYRFIARHILELFKK